MSTAPAPPRLARALLRLAVPDDAGPAVEGDLHELFVARRAASGAGAAAVWYWIETLSFVMRFMLDGLARSVRGLFGGEATPSRLDLKLGARLLAKSPGLAIVGGLGMAVAIALGAGAYAFVNTYFYPELPLAEGDRVVAIGKFDKRLRWKDKRLLHDFLVWRRELRTVVDLGASRTVQRNIGTAVGEGPAEPITLAEMTASGFRLARVPAFRGRTLVEDDERPGAPPVIVIGYDAWQSRFAGDPSVVGREVRIGRHVHTIVGVMPAGFAFPINHQYWIPLRAASGAAVAPGMGPELHVFGRLARGATREAAQAELGALGRRLAAEGPPALATLEPRLIPYVDVVVNGEVDGSSAAMVVLRFVIALLLVVVALNVAVLVYARTVTRTGEIAVRTALGASRARIVAQLFAEAFVLSALSAAVGLAMVSVALDMMDQFIDEVSGGRAPFWIDPGLSLGAVVYALGLAVLSAVIIGALPALRATGAQLRAAIGSLGSGAKARLGKTWTVLIVAQVAIAVAVLPAAIWQGGQMVRAAYREPGFAPGEYLSTQFVVQRDADAVTAPRAESAAADSVRAIAAALLVRLATEPGVIGAAVTSGWPWEGGGSLVEADGVDQPPQRVGSLDVDTGYFGLFDVRTIAGRGFTEPDAALPRSDRPVIVNRSFVTEVLGGERGAHSAVGRRVRYRAEDGEVNPWHVVVGVVEDFPVGLPQRGETSSARLFHLAAPGELGGGGLLMIRLRAQIPEAFTPTLRRIATSVDPMLQLSPPRSLYRAYRDHTRTGVRVALVIALITGSVLLLSAAGIHAVMSFTVNDRRREIGIRSALGAPPRRVLASVLTRATKQLGVGVAIGLAAAVAVDRASGGVLLEGTAVLLIPGTAALMLGVGLLAAAGPARRGLRVQPTESLRAE